MSIVTYSYCLPCAIDGLCHQECVPSIALVIGCRKLGSLASHEPHCDCCLLKETQKLKLNYCQLVKWQFKVNM